MNLKNQNQKFIFLEVIDKVMLEKVFAFRYNIISKTKIYQNYFHENNFTHDKESDQYDPYSIHFVALDEDGEICANVRLIHNSPIGYPTENEMVFDNTMFQRDKLGEMSRIFIDAKYRSIATSKIIINEVKKFMYAKMIKLGIEYTYGALEPRFSRLLKMFKMNYEVLGKEQMQGKMGLRLPCILYTKKLGDDNPEIKRKKEKNV